MKNQEKLKKISDAFYLINSICCDLLLLWGCTRDPSANGTLKITEGQPSLPPPPRAKV